MAITAQIFHSHDRPLELRTFPEPDLAAGECLVRIDRAAICGSDLHTLAGTRQEPTPCVLGHEGVGTVVAAGAGRADEIGRRISWTIADSCGRCRPCVRDRLPQKCDRLVKYGHAALSDGSGLNGTYATHIVIRAGTTIVAIPDSVGDALAVSANCSLATMVGVVRAMFGDLRSVESVVVQGAGLLGVHGCALLVEAGVDRVYCTDVDPNRLAIVADIGAIAVDDSERGAALAEIRRLEPEGVDAVIEVAGLKDLVADGVDMVRAGGWYGLVGMVHPDSAFPVTAEAIIRRCLMMRGIHNYAPVDLIDAVAFLERSGERFGLDRLVSEPLGLDELDVAIDSARRRDHLRVTVGG